MKAIKYDEEQIKNKNLNSNNNISSIEFVSPYAEKIAYKRYNNGQKNRVLAEDFAESVRRYLDPNDTEFNSRYEGRCKVLKKLLGE